jgi:hypothetical protein
MHKQQRTCLVSDLNVGALLISDTFFCSRTHPAMLESFGKAATDELLSSVISFKEKYMLLCPALEHFLKRGASLAPQEATIKDVILGARNMLQTVSNLHHLEWETIDCTVKSWNTSRAGKDRLLKILRGKELTEKPVMIFDLLST